MNRQTSHVVEVDVVVPVHRLDRPIERAVGSVLDFNHDPKIQVTVVCHGMDSADIRRRLADRTRVRIIDHVDGIASPAGPVNAALDMSQARYFSRLDSDDALEPGAVDAWLSAARASGADVVIAPLRPVGGDIAYAPLTRPFRHTHLDPVRDRLSYRTAPFGLLRIATIRQLGARYTSGLSTGEDLEFGLRVWFGAGRIDLAAHAPAYLVHDDASERVTRDVQGAGAEMEPIRLLLAGRWFRERSMDERTAIVVKLARIHVLGSLRRSHAASSVGEDIPILRDVLTSFDALAPQWQRPFNRSDSAALDAVRNGDADAVPTVLGTGSRWRSLTAPTLRGTVGRESTLRRYVRYALPR